MKVVMMSREYPPEVYGGAGVHVEYLSRELARRVDMEVRCFGAPRPYRGPPVARAFQPWEGLASDQAYAAALQTMSVDLSMVSGMEDAAIVHSHTWYTNFAGHLAKLMYEIPHVATTHSLEPMRPWKAEQLGPGGYAVSKFCEQTGLEGADAIIAVSEAMREDVLGSYPSLDRERVRVLHNGIDAGEYSPDPNTDVLDRYGIETGAPYVVFVGRITRQKGIVHLLDAALHIDSYAKIVLCAGAPDTPEIAQEVSERVQRVQEERGNVLWIQEMLPKPEVVQILTHASVFCCPSIYEPLGIVNLEAMACGTAVVATDTGGIAEVVEEGVTGYLVPLDVADAVTRTPKEPEAFARALAGRIDELLADPGKARAFGEAGRARVLENFTWEAVADRTVALYEELV